MSATPLLIDIKSNSLDDGPGIRSVVFFKGCPLSCIWCHNPEAVESRAELSFDPDKCIDTRGCVASCPEAALRPNGKAHPDGRVLLDRQRCTECWRCLPACPSGALSRIGESVSVEQLVGRLLKDKPFYDNSGGGVTLSGGEPTRCMEFLGKLVEALTAEGVHTLLQTCGVFSLERFTELVYGKLDLIYFDLKLFDSEAHRQHCGATNSVILSNFEELQARALDGGVPILPRVPLVPGLTDSDENLGAIAGFLAERQVSEVQLVEYNPLWPAKSARLGHGVSERLTGAKWQEPNELARCRAPFENAGLLLAS